MSDNNRIELDRHKNHWIESSDKDFETMSHLFDTKDYDWALFIGHLVIEKLLKAYFISLKNELPPYIHNLLRLAELCNIELNRDSTLFYSTVTGFNINSRYDDYRNSFYRKCTKEYTENWIKQIEEYRRWIKSLL